MPRISAKLRNVSSTLSCNDQSDITAHRPSGKLYINRHCIGYIKVSPDLVPSFFPFSSTIKDTLLIEEANITSVANNVINSITLTQ